MTANEGPAPQTTGTGPSENVAAAKPLSLEAHGRTAGVTPTSQGIRRRQSAARRLPPLENGRRDTLGGRRPMPAPCARSLHVEVGRQTVWLKGDDVRELLVFAQIPDEDKRYDLIHAAWAVSLDVAEHVVTAAEWWQRRHVTTEAVDR